MTAISISGLVKTLGRFRALDELDLVVEEGEVHGFLGPNGSGKTTAIRALLGLLRADSGVVRVLGHDPWRDNITLHGRIAYVPGEVKLWPRVTGGEVIDLMCSLRGESDRRRRDELIERFELDPRKKSRAHSKGNRQKVALIAALSSDAELLLDEPTSGLDPMKEAEFQRCTDEETGRTELIRSARIGRAAPVATALALAGVANLAVAVAVAVTAIATGLPVGGSVSTGVALAGVGCVFAAFTALAAQVFDNPRSVYGATITALGLAYLLRAVGDVGSGVAS